MSARKKKIPKWTLGTIIGSILAVIAAVILIVVNIFIPLKYLSAYCVTKDKNSQGQIRVTFIDVGYGDSTLIELTDGKCILVDAGSGTSPSNNKILKTLNRAGIDTIDYLISTSVCQERCGGLAEIIKYKTVGEIFALDFPVTEINAGYRSFSMAIEGKNIYTAVFGNGIFNEKEGYYLCFLSPSERGFEKSEIDNLIKEPNKENANNASASVWFEYDGVGFLFTGNGNESEQQKTANLFSIGAETGKIKITPENLKILKLPNHGAYSCSPILNKYKPSAAVLSVGNNSYGYPLINNVAEAQSVVGSSLYRTDNDGNITVTVRDGKCVIEKEKR